MSVNVYKAIEFVLKNEGGFTIDNGGPTNFGITAKYLTKKGLVKTYDRNRNGIIDADDMRNFTREDAIKEYTIMFLENKYNLINDIDVVTRIFDCAVNCGDRRAVLLSQQAYNQCVPYNHLDCDGILGNLTSKSINEYCIAGKSIFIYSFKEKRIEFYKRLAKINPIIYGPSLNGWITRASL